MQGDEPFISPAAIDAVSEALEHLAPDTLAVNAYTELTDVGQMLSVVDDGLAVDTPEDLARADRFLRSRQLP
ncbi:hypothetical protein GCM10010222_33620 [Streptomyces tanashiensis]|uniref:hypothetical protein n=1 Tax=Streptomyces tanashiensis TaxID=67367 RepID=UPI0019C29A6C|nr:hypothetical protein [Streptomyces tanashiensis]GGS89352.1 hypothetical protein GCM10010222_33620 [Streptomyces tanashiensis]